MNSFNNNEHQSIHISIFSDSQPTSQWNSTQLYYYVSHYKDTTDLTAIHMI